MHIITPSGEPWRQFVWDLIYLALTIGFFALMFLYVRACEALGRRQSEGDDR